MNIKKRGLGRGLEALLVDVSVKEEKHQLQTLPPDDMNSDELQELAIELIETTQKENLNLLEEAEALKTLMDEFEAMLRQF